MDVYESERALEKQSKLGTTRLPLLPAENKNGTIRRSRIREVSSRYLSPTHSATTIPKRSQSPIPTRTSSTSVLSTTKRALSAERKRPSRPSSPNSPSPSTPIQDTSAEALLASRKIAGNKLPESLWPSTMRSLSVSFQSDAISVPVTVSKREKQVSHTPDRTLRPSSSNLARKQVENSLSRKPTPERNRSPLKTDQPENFKPLNSLSRKPTPERKISPLKAGQLENSKPVDGLHSRLLDQHRWPSKATEKVSSNFLNKSVDLSDKGSKLQSLVPSRPSTPSLRRLSLDGATKPLQKSSSDLLMQLSFDDSSVRLRKAGSLVSSDRTSSVNAATNKSVDLSDKGSKIQSLVPSRPSTPSLRRLSLDGATKPLQKSSSDLLMQLSSYDSSVRLRKAGSLVSSDRNSLVNAAAKALSVSSPVSRPVSPSVSSRGVSPSRLRPNPSSRGPSPARARPSSPSRQSQSSNSVLSFIADIKGKKASNHIEDVHQLRLLYNRHLQWRYANAQTYAALNLQKAKAEKMLYNVWRMIVNLRGSVIEKKTDLQRLKLQLQLFLVLNNQLTCLDEWASIERDHTNSVTSIIQDLQASTIRIPVTGGAKGDIETVKTAVCSAVDVMQAMGSSLRSVLSRVEAMNTLVSELADVAAHERATLIECELVLGSTTALQVQENSLRTHLLQMKEAYG